MRVVDIPMKESTPDASRAIYEVTLLYPARGQHPSIRAKAAPSEGACDGSSSPDYLVWSKLDPLTELQTQVSWRNVKNFAYDSRTCTCLHRVTPLAVTSSPSRCLMKYVQSGKLVALLDASAPQGVVASHFLRCINGDVFLHCLCAETTRSTEPIPLPTPSIALQSFVRDLTGLIRANFIVFGRDDVPLADNLVGNFQPSGVELSADGSQLRYFTTDTLVRTSRSLPSVPSSRSIIDCLSPSCSEQVGTFMRGLRSATIAQKDIPVLHRVIGHVHYCASRNDPSLFRGLPAHENPDHVQQAYAELWRELRSALVANQGKSAEHAKVC